jgi:tetratricopeptide (TPR) repeat protein
LASGNAVTQAQRELGRLYSKQGRLPEAEAALKEYCALHPDDPEGLYLYSDTLRRMHKSDSAVMARFRQVKAVEERRKNLLLRVQVDPQNVQARLEQARFLASHGETAFALLCYERVLHLDPGNQEARRAITSLRDHNAGGDSP